MRLIERIPEKSAPCTRGWTWLQGRLSLQIIICPVYTGMNLWQSYGIFEKNDLPRIHGDAP